MACFLARRPRPAVGVCGVAARKTPSCLYNVYNNGGRLGSRAPQGQTTQVGQHNKLLRCSSSDHWHQIAACQSYGCFLPQRRRRGRENLNSQRNKTEAVYCSFARPRRPDRRAAWLNRSLANLNLRLGPAELPVHRLGRLGSIRGPEAVTVSDCESVGPPPLEPWSRGCMDSVVGRGRAGRARGPSLP
jgi:hypothetical protein